jgi:hypothetical protein
VNQIQAFDRTQRGLPMKKGRQGTLTHDDKRNGTTTLFAALDVLKGEVIGQCMKRHRHQEFLAFLKTIGRGTPKHLDIHGIADRRSRRSVFAAVFSRACRNLNVLSTPISSTTMPLRSLSSGQNPRTPSSSRSIAAERR